jgi:hypothetical protein
MKRLSLSFLFFFLLAENNLFCQALQAEIIYSASVDNNGGNLIFYEAGNKVAVKDFLGEPLDNGNVLAITSSGFAFDAAFKKENGVVTKLQIKVNCSFNKQKSWMKPAGKNEYTLNHEQRHFDISYISCQLFIKNLRSAKFTNSNIKTLLNDIYEESARAMERLQNQYDEETMNGINEEKQAAWNKKIDDLLVQHLYR